MEKKIMVTHVRAGSIGRLVGTVNAIFALAAGIVGSIVAASTALSAYDYGILGSIGVSVGIVAVGVVLLPLLAFAFGWLYGALIGVIWNILLGATGGLEIGVEDLKEEKESKK